MLGREAMGGGGGSLHRGRGKRAPKVAVRDAASTLARASASTPRGGRSEPGEGRMNEA